MVGCAGRRSYNPEREAERHRAADVAADLAGQADVVDQRRKCTNADLRASWDSQVRTPSGPPPDPLRTPSGPSGPPLDPVQRCVC
eukprot:294018-Prorocentrum_minimum.AAC.1